MIIQIRKKYRSAIFSWVIHIWNFKTLAYTVLNLSYAHENNKWPKIAKGHNQQNFIKMAENLFRWSPPQSQSVYQNQGSSLNTFWDILLMRFQCYFIKRGNNSKMGDNMDKKKIRFTNFFMRNPYMKYQNISTHGSKLMLCKIKQKMGKNGKGP